MILLGVLLPSFMAGIRYDVGGDYASYLKMYNNVVNGRQMYFRSIEPLSAGIINFSAHIQSSFTMFFIFNLITNICFVVAFKILCKGDNNRTAQTYFIYLCILYPASLFVMRSSISASVLMISFALLMRKWNLKTVIASIVLILIAFMFHRTAALAFLFLPIFYFSEKFTRKKNSSKKMLLILALYIIGMLMVPTIYKGLNGIVRFGDYDRYLTTIGESFSIPLANVLMFTPIIYAFACIFKRKSEYDTQLAKLAYCSTSYIAISVLVGWLTLVGVPALSRLSIMLEPLVICLMAYQVGTIKNLKGKSKMVASICMAMIICMMLVRNLNWSISLPYKTIFQQDISYAPGH